MDVDIAIGGFTPPSGRLGHSLPAGRKLQTPDDRLYNSMMAVKREGLSSPTSPYSASLYRSLEVQYGERVGSPRYPTHMDMMRGRRQVLENSSSFITQDVLEEAEEEDLETPLSGRKPLTPPITLDKFNGDSLNSYSFSAPYNKRSSFVSSRPSSSRSSVRSPSTPGLNQSNASRLSQSEYAEFIPIGDDGPLFPTALRNPNKALVTIDLHTSEILMANDVVYSFFGYRPSELIGTTFEDLLAYGSGRLKQSELLEENVDADGSVVIVPGRVVDAIDKFGTIFPVSLWMKVLVLKPCPRGIAVMEPVQRYTGLLSLTKEGNIVEVDEALTQLFAYGSADELAGKPASTILPHIRLPDQSANSMPKELFKQELTGLNKSGRVMPLSVAVRSSKVKPIDDDPFPYTHPIFASSKAELSVVVWMYTHLSGLVTVREEGTIFGCNDTFITLLFGYEKEDLVGKDISFLLPDFYQDITGPFETSGMSSSESDDDVALPPMDDDVDLSTDCSTQHAASDDTGVEGSSDLVETSTHTSKTSYAAQSDDSGLVQAAVSLRLTDEQGTLDDSAPVRGQGVARTDGQSTRSELTQSRQEQRHSAASHHRTPTASPGAPSSRPTSSRHVRSGATPTAMLLDGNNSPLRPSSPLSKPFTSTPVKLLEALPSGQQVLLGRSGRLDRSWQFTKHHLAQSLPDEVRGVHGLTFHSRGRHRDGSSFKLIVQIKSVIIDDGTSLFCLWVQREAISDEDPLLSMSMSFSRAANLSQMADDTAGKPTSGEGVQSANLSVGRTSAAICASRSLDVETANELFEGPYEDSYLTIKSIGKGAFGEVKLAVQRSTSRSVVVKFINKSSVLTESWKLLEEDEFDALDIRSNLSYQSNGVPIEIVLLRRLKHDNIVKVLDVFENDQYYQLVMERHGDGMDLFEFIDRSPQMDEPLASYIFRQVASGVDYLHSNNILHRDIKDENIIINDMFCIKLIDFGSAAYMEEGQLFSTFCGTLEYCSPEVLLGNKYPGPQLEMWSLGVTLYTLIFSENPFVDADDIVEGQLRPPRMVSPGLLKIILWLLHPDPTSRCNMKQLLCTSWMKQTVHIENYRFDEVIGGEVTPLELAPERKVEEREERDDYDINLEHLNLSFDSFTVLRQSKSR